MNKRSEQIAGGLLFGALVPVLAVVWAGLINEGFSSLAFLFYPGPETYLQAVLLAVFAFLLARTLSTLRGSVLHVARGVWSTTVVAGVAGVVLAGSALYLVGLGEAPWRKFYTYAVAPRAVTAWLLCAVLAMLPSHIHGSLRVSARAADRWRSASSAI